MKAEDDSLVAVVNAAYLFIAVLFCAIGAFSTYQGMRFLPWFMNIPLSLSVFGTLLICDVLILRAKREGGGIIKQPRTMRGPFFMLLLIAVLSTSSSFTYFYSATMRDKLAAARAKSAAEVFEANFLAVNGSLRALPSATARSHEIDLALSNLETQVLNSGRLGFGPDAMDIVDNIYAIMKDLGAPITPMAFPSPPGTPERNKAALERFTAAVRAKLEEAKAGDGVTPAMQKIEKIHDSMQQIVTSARDEAATANYDGHVKNIVSLDGANVDMEREANSVVSALSPGKPLLKLPSANIVGIGLYTIPEVYAVAFSNVAGFPYAIGSLIGALMCDLIPFFFAAWMVHPSAGDTGGRRSGSRSASPSLNITGSNQW